MSSSTLKTLVKDALEPPSVLCIVQLCMYLIALFAVERRMVLEDVRHHVGRVVLTVEDQRLAVAYVAGLAQLNLGGVVRVLVIEATTLAAEDALANCAFYLAFRA